MPEPMKTEDTTQNDAPITLDPAEAAFVDQVEGMLGDPELGDVAPEVDEPTPPKKEVKDEDETKPGTDEEDAGDEDEEDEPDEDTRSKGEPDEGEEEEDEPKVSIRINGKKATVEDLLNLSNHTVVVNGEELEVPYQELIKGYQRGRDYSQKTTELKKMREELAPYAQLVAHAKADPQFVEFVKSYFERGPLPPEVVNNPLLQVTDEQLAEMLDSASENYDPEKAAEVVKARKEFQATAAQRQQQQQMIEQQQKELLEQWAEDQTNEARYAIDAEFGEGAFDKYGPQVVKYLREEGFTDEEIASLVDARLTRMAYKAAILASGATEKTAPKVRLGRKRKQHEPPRASRSGQGKRKPSSKAKRDTYRKAVKSQRQEDWLDAIEARLNL